MTSVPDPSARVVDDAGKVTTTWHAFLKSLVRLQEKLDKSVASVEGAAAGKSQTFAEAILIEFPTAKDYKFLAVGFTGDVEAVETVLTSGTCTVTVLLDNVSMGGTNAASSTKNVVEYDANNSVTPTTDIIIRVSAATGPIDLSVTLRGTMRLT